MLRSSHRHTATRLATALSLLILTDGGATARTAPRIGSVEAAPVVGVGIAPIAIAPPDQAPREIHKSVERGPFGLIISHNSGLAIRWRRLQPAIHAETRLLTLCRAHPADCTPAASRFLAIVDTARADTGLARIGKINRAVNLAIRPMSDQAQYGVADVWATPLMTFANGAGDCEDYAIAKYVALREAGMAAGDLALVVLHNRVAREDHAVTAARLNGRWIILDNQRMALLADSDLHNMTPLMALDSAPAVASPVVASAAVPPADTAPKPQAKASRAAGSTITVSDVFFTDPSRTLPGFPLAMAG